ncbi:MAG: hypothetical protein E5Y06_29180 [Mesorhizobium sp.]|nr:MAG: hypothetical protein E5Y06_29180 [Mesorhizobium sp.]TJU94315.1 MAG: hypothetical protein E5Y08_30570 [Mesorhizobium sp.]TJV16721.1 MAG: hypothetical protein E5Y07_15825 [Mesorhizobium sp.]
MGDCRAKGLPASPSSSSGWEGFQSLSFVPAQSSSNARYAFDGVRTRAPHTKNLANRARRLAAMN